MGKRLAQQNGGALRVQSQNKLGADTKIRTASAYAPEQFCIFGIAESQRRPIRRDKSRLCHLIKRA